ncbi:MAG TPA: DUF1566 domain-containing protein [Polyangiaceae bacterium]|nr:DUF1566 domain-containing protein [Polyangiaceae bacterium]HOD24747.1 DUF1566 domain-containing protein [Polyangiaceae bacterium]HOR35226.1 DUF1566 domain-containing protein [Polyangiaceae bacterium]HPK95104.1 DUF1566 domain-containing protein [Polyangiaceae bacterium]HQM12539.1 DUF1566 domain-containing protein [Polyangiaceae bacterium]
MPILAACSHHAAQIAKQPDLSSLDKVEGAKCSLASSQPLVVDWSPTRRGALESALRRGLLVVKYTGCRLEVLDHCHPAAHEAGYAYVPINPKREGHSFKTADDLYAQMPMGAAQLEGKLQSSGELRLEMNIVGRFESQVDEIKSSELEGSGCDEATHAVKAASVGAFKLFSAASANESGSVASATSGLRSSGSAEKESLSEDGNADACAKATGSDDAPPYGCAALIRLELVPIKWTVAGSVVRRDRVCPVGMIASEDGSCMPFEAESAEGASGRAGSGASAEGRFVATDETVFDTTTGLTWQRAPAPDRMTWEQGKAYCRGLVVGGTHGWRLPKKSELETLVARRPAPKIDVSMFPGTAPEPFWTFAADRESPGDAHAIDFSTGRTVSLGCGTHRSVRCVR